MIRHENGRWTQPAGYGKAVTYPACEVTDSTETDSVPRYAGPAPAPQPQPWTAEEHATITNRKPASEWTAVGEGHYIRLQG